MARLIPVQIYSQTASPAEKDVFQKLASDPDTQDWIVLHSLDIAEHTRNVVGEADFVIVVPFMGVVCLEVKGSHTIRHDNGLWYFGQNPIPERRGPFRQAAEAMHSIRNYLVAQEKQLQEIPFCSAVIFPYVHFTIKSGEWHEWQVIDNKSLERKSLGQIILKILLEARKKLKTTTAWFDDRKKEPAKAQVEKIANILRPNFEVHETPRSRISRINQEVKKYTEEQFTALDAMESNPRVVFTGPAGTGKTTLAIEAARRSIHTNRRVLFLCFNRLLGKYLEGELEPLGTNIRVGTLHSHMLAVAGIQVEQSSATFWTSELPQKAIDKLLEIQDPIYIYDEIIIDEAQDLLRSQYLDFIDLSLRGGLKGGRWKLFGDFERQVIYDSVLDFTLEKALLERFGNATRYTLRVNCRNTPRIVALIHLLSGLSPEYSRVLRPDDGLEPEIGYYRTPEEQQKSLLEIIAQLRAEGFKNSDIVVLSTKATEKAVASTVVSEEIRFAPFEQASRKQIAMGSIHAFKGLESPVIIVTDVESILDDHAISLFYVAITRAVHRLYILASDKVKSEILKVLGV